MSKEPKESVISPCDKTECSGSELINLCIGGVYPCGLWIEGTKEAEKAVLSVSPSKNGRLLNFCLWRQDGEKLRLIQRFYMLHPILAQLEGAIKYSRERKSEQIE
jgi:hypothetical protein